MERPALAAAIGAGSATVALLALTGVLDAPIALVVLLLVAARAAATMLAGRPLARSRCQALLIAAASLAGLAAWRAGSATLDGVRGANAVLGPGATTTPVRSAVAIAIAALAVLVASAAITRAATPRVGGASEGLEGSPMGDWMERVGILATVLFVVTAAGGPDLDRVVDLLPWSIALLVALVAVRLLEPIAAHARTATLVQLVAVAAAVVGAWS